MAEDQGIHNQRPSLSNMTERLVFPGSVWVFESRVIATTNLQKPEQAEPPPPKRQSSYNSECKSVGLIMDMGTYGELFKGKSSHGGC